MLHYLILMQDIFRRSRKKSDVKTFVLIERRVNRVFFPGQEKPSVWSMRWRPHECSMYGLLVVEFLNLIYSYAVVCGSKAIPEAWEKWQQANRDWYYRFMKRHPTPTLKTPEHLTFNRTNVDLFFNVAGAFLPPSTLYNSTREVDWFCQERDN